MASISQTVSFAASPHELYNALMDSKLHTEFSGSEAKIGRSVGDEFSTFDGWVVGKNVELVKDKKIIQTWHPDMEHWPADHDSTVTFQFEQLPDGKTKLHFTHTEIPPEYVEELRTGWNENYWEPLKQMFPGKK